MGLRGSRGPLPSPLYPVRVAIGGLLAGLLAALVVPREGGATAQLRPAAPAPRLALCPAPEPPTPPESAALGSLAADESIDGMAEPPAEQADAHGRATACPEGMVEVAGEYCPAMSQVCLEYIGNPSHDRCARFRPTGPCRVATISQHFCIDRYEYPNLAGTHPMVAVTWEDAQALCDVQGKRLCTAEEWTHSCEGEARLPYPNGYERDADACNFDRSYLLPDDRAYKSLATREMEAHRLSQSEPSGFRPACVSEYGAYDLTGNVDEWVVNARGSQSAVPYTSGLKGGYWGPVRNRCRPMTVDHNQWHSGYQIGFRCCREADESAPSGPLHEPPPHPQPATRLVLAVTGN